METQEIKAESYIPLAKELKDKRKMMGLRSVHVHRELGINQGNYSKMENAFMNPLPALIWVRCKFQVWKDTEIQTLNKRIKFLNSIK